MKRVFAILFFSFILTISGQINPNDLSKYEISNVVRKSYNLEKFVSNKNVKLIYFFNDKSCKLCFANQFSQLKKLNDNKQFIIITNFKRFNTLKSYASNYGLKNVFLISPVTFSTSFYYNVATKQIFIPGINRGINLFIFEALQSNNKIKDTN